MAPHMTTRSRFHPLRPLFTGMLALLPLAATLALLAWATRLAAEWLGPSSLLGSLLTRIGVGFGPGAESQAHAPNEITWKQDLATCAAVYALTPTMYKGENKTDDVCQFRAGKTNNNIR